MNKKIEIPILMYHRVIKEKSEEGIFGTYVYESELKKQFNFLKSKNIKPITFEDIDTGILDKKDKYVILTFDDGYSDNYTILYPLLKEFGFKAVIYPVTDQSYNLWDTEHPTTPEKKLPLMDWKQLRELKDSGLIEFGAHTKNHCNLLEVNNQKAFLEIEDSKKALEKELGIEVLSFAYPYGFFNDEHKKMVELAGYKFGVATASGPVNFYEDFYHIRRIGIFSKDNINRYKRKVNGDYNSKKVRAENLKEFRRKIKRLFGWER